MINSRRNMLYILMPPLLVALLFCIAAFGVFLPAFHERLLDKKKEMIRELTNTAWSIVASYENREKSGLMSRDEAQRDAAKKISEIRYGAENKDYFWINDMAPVMIMHPYRMDLAGQHLDNFADPTGKHLFLEFVETVQNHGAGYVSYMWQWKDDSSRIVPKLSYVRGFSPWDWVIGTGIYLDDVEMEISVLSRSLLLFSILILFVVLLITLFIVRQGLEVSEKYRRAEEEVRQQRDHLEEQVAQRTAELADSNTQLKREVEQRRHAQEQIQRDHTFLSTIIESLPFPFYVTDARDYTILMANSKACENGQGISDKCYALTHGRTSPCTSEEHLCPLEEVKRTRKPVKTEHIHTDRSGKTEYVEVHGYPIFDEQGSIGQMIEFSLNITQRKTLEEQLRHASLTDPLTGLYNRRGFMTMTEKQLELSRRIEVNAYLLFIDIDDMKTINDSFGHEAGDQALKATADILRATLRGADTIGRLGGDEFAAFLFNGSSANHAETIISRLEEAVAALNSRQKYAFRLALSCGILPVEASLGLNELLSRADALMYERKKQRKTEIKCDRNIG